MTVTAEIDNHCDSQWTPDETMCQQWLRTTFEHLDQQSNFSVALRFVNKAESQSLNQCYRDKASPTNVLSFPAEIPNAVAKEMDHPPLGDLVICPELVAEEASEQQKPLESHWAHLTIHGCLHLLGYDHQTEEQASSMENIEIEILKKLGISNPYLIG